MATEALQLPDAYLQPLGFVQEEDGSLVLAACVNSYGLVTLLNSQVMIQRYEDFARVSTETDIMLRKGDYDTSHFVFNGCVKSFLAYYIDDPFESVHPISAANQKLQTALITDSFGTYLLSRMLVDPLAEHTIA